MYLFIISVSPCIHRVIYFDVHRKEYVFILWFAEFIHELAEQGPYIHLFISLFIYTRLYILMHIGIPIHPRFAEIYIHIIRFFYIHRIILLCFSHNRNIFIVIFLRMLRMRNIYILPAVVSFHTLTEYLYSYNFFTFFLPSQFLYSYNFFTFFFSPA